MNVVKSALVVLFCAIFAASNLLSSNRVGAQISSLGAPTGLKASDGAYRNKIGLDWDAVAGATTYRVFRAATNDVAAAVAVGATPANSFFDQTAPEGVNLWYWVRAENGNGPSPMSSSDSGLRAVQTLPVGPLQPLEPPPVAPGNPDTAAKTYLGKALFWDEQLSSTSTVACGTCHHASSGGTDPRSVAVGAAAVAAGPDGLTGTPDDVVGSLGVPLSNANGTLAQSAFGLAEQATGRKSVSHVNAAYAPLLFWDGRASNTFRDPISGAVVLNTGAALESQVLEPPVSPVEMAHSGRNWNDIATKIAQSKPLALSPSVPQSLINWLGSRRYPDLFLEAFGTSEVTPSRIAIAIAAYERTLYSDRAPIDLDTAGVTALTAQEIRGRNVFQASACNTCHAGSLFTDNSFRYIGVRPQADDLGRFAITGQNGDRGAFRVPSLRNVELRQTYFHNGRFSSLEDVIAFYNRGGDFNAPNKPPQIRPLGLNANQRADLAAFLRRPLTDPRVAAETDRFDRPQLFAESSRTPSVTGTGRSGSGGLTPSIRSISPPLAGNQGFVVSLTSAVGNANAVLVVSETDPGVVNTIPASGFLARVESATQGTGAGTGWTSAVIAIPSDAASIGKTYFARWYVPDPGAAGGLAVSPALRFTVFGEATAAASQISISGRVLTPEGLGLRNARVVITNSQGVVRTATTSSFGTFVAEGIASNETYVMTVSSKRYRFAPKQISVGAVNVSNLDFIGLE